MKIELFVLKRGLERTLLKTPVYPLGWEEGDEPEYEYIWYEHYAPLEKVELRPRRVSSFIPGMRPRASMAMEETNYARRNRKIKAPYQSMPLGLSQAVARGQAPQESVYMCNIPEVMLCSTYHMSLEHLHLLYYFLREVDSMVKASDTINFRVQDYLESFPDTDNATLLNTLEDFLSAEIHPYGKEENSIVVFDHPTHIKDDVITLTISAILGQSVFALGNLAYVHIKEIANLPTVEHCCIYNLSKINIWKRIPKNGVRTGGEETSPTIVQATLGVYTIPTTPISLPEPISIELEKYAQVFKECTPITTLKSWVNLGIGYGDTLAQLLLVDNYLFTVEFDDALALEQVLKDYLD